MPKLTIAEVTTKTTKGSKPYLNIKSSTGKYYNCWQDAQYIWGMIKVGETIEPTLTQEGTFPPSITGILGVEPPNQSGGTTVARWPERGAETSFGAGNGNVGPSAWDKLFQRLEKLEVKIDWLIEERKTLGLPEHPMGWKEGNDGFYRPEKSPSLRTLEIKEEPKLSDLPVTELPD